MRITKATVVATGALAAFAVTSAAPAFAAAVDQTGSATTVMAPTYQGQHRNASEDSYKGGGGPGDGFGWHPGFTPQALASAADGSNVIGAPIQIAGAAAGVGAAAVAAPINSPSTVVGDANNANTVLTYFG